MMSRGPRILLIFVSVFLAALLAGQQQSVEEWERQTFERQPPEKVMDAALPFMAPQMIAMTQQLGLSTMWVGGWRGASEILAKPLWERFVWPYLEKIAFEVLDAGIIPWFHLDSDWTRDL